MLAQEEKAYQTAKQGQPHFECLCVCFAREKEIKLAWYGIVGARKKRKETICG